MATIPTPGHPTLPESPPASAISRLSSRYAGNPRAEWIIYFIATALGGIAAVLLLLWALNDFHGLGLDAAGTVALMLGITLTSAPVSGSWRWSSTAIGAMPTQTLTAPR